MIFLEWATMIGFSHKKDVANCQSLLLIWYFGHVSLYPNYKQYNNTILNKGYGTNCDVMEEYIGCTS
jgi:hypothetical protein